MKTVSIINLKGGVGKTITAINMAYILSDIGNRVLLVDNDKQGNTSKFFGVHSYNRPSLAEVLTEKNFPTVDAIANTKYQNLDVLPANMNLLRADKQILMDCTRPQQTRLSKAHDTVSQLYDYVVIDNAPDLDMGVINALVASDDVIIPMKVDKFAFDGIEQLTEQIAEVKEFNPKIKVAGCLITMAQNNNVNALGRKFLTEYTALPLFETAIRKTVKVDESTFTGKPLLIHSPTCTASKDYLNMVGEYLRGQTVTETITKGAEIND